MMFDDLIDWLFYFGVVCITIGISIVISSFLLAGAEWLFDYFF